MGREEEGGTREEGVGSSAQTQPQLCSILLFAVSSISESKGS